MAAGRKNIVMDGGGLFDKSIIWQNVDGSPVDISDKMAMMHIRDSNRSLVAEFTEPTGSIVNKGASGTFYLKMNSFETGLLPSGVFRYDLEMHPITRSVIVRSFATPYYIIPVSNKNDIQASGGFSSSGENIITVSITEEASPPTNNDKFNVYVCTDPSSYNPVTNPGLLVIENADISAVSTPLVIVRGVGIGFSSQTGHSVGDTWAIPCSGVEITPAYYKSVYGARLCFRWTNMCYRSLAVFAPYDYETLTGSSKPIHICGFSALKWPASVNMEVSISTGGVGSAAKFKWRTSGGSWSTEISCPTDGSGAYQMGDYCAVFFDSTTEYTTSDSWTFVSRRQLIKIENSVQSNNNVVREVRDYWFGPSYRESILLVPPLYDGVYVNRDMSATLSRITVDGYNVVKLLEGNFVVKENITKGEYPI